MRNCKDLIQVVNGVDINKRNRGAIMTKSMGDI